MVQKEVLDGPRTKGLFNGEAVSHLPVQLDQTGGWQDFLLVIAMV